MKKLISTTDGNGVRHLAAPINQVFSTGNGAGAKQEWLVGYSEWRPTRWLLTTSTGLNYGLFNSHDRAVRFSEGVRMSLSDMACDGDYISICPVRSTGYDTWLGDNIGCSLGAPASIEVRDQFGIHRSLPVWVVLSAPENLDAHGLTRIVMGLRVSTDVLHPDDLAAWREHEDEYPVFQIGGIEGQVL